MKKHITTLKRVAVPANLTEVFALIAVIGGLCISIFLPELPIRLIGICISVLGALGYFMLVSQRIADSINYRQINVSQSTEFTITTQKNEEGKRTSFDDFKEIFGGSNDRKQEGEDDKNYIDKLRSVNCSTSADNQDSLFSNSEDINISIATGFNEEGGAEQKNVPPCLIIGNKDFTNEETKGNKKKRTFGDTPPDITNIQPRTFDDFDESSFGMRILRKITSEPPPQSVSNEKKSGSSSRTIESSKSSILPPRRTLNHRQSPLMPTVSAVEQSVAVNAAPMQSAEPFVYAESTTIAGESKIDIENSQPKAESAVVALQIDDVEVAVAEAEESPRKQEQISNTFYRKKQESGYEHNGTHQNTPKLDLFEEMPPVVQNEPRKELDYLLTRVLMVIRSVTAARTAVFLWVDNDKQRLVLESFISDIPDNLTQQKKLPFGTDVVSQIARSGRPEILTEIKPSAELDLIPYYSESAETLSFIGVPVFYNNSVVGVLCADTTQAEAYDAITVGFFGHFTKLISGLVHSYTDKYDLMQATRALEAITQFRSLVSMSQSGMADVCTALLEAASKTVEYSTLGIVIYDTRLGEWKVAQTMCRADITPGALGGIVNLDKSLAGYTIQNCKSNLVAPMYPGYLRCTESEEPIESGFFASVPLKSFSHNYGALFVEGNNPPMTAQDLAILEVLGEQTGLIIEQMRFNDMLSSMSLVNETRGILNPTAFRQRINEELQRAVDFTVPMTLCLIQLDKYDTVDAAGDAAEIILQNIIELIRKQIKPYDIIGELDSSTIALGLVGQESQKVRLWAERLRKEIASTVVQLDNRRFTVTVSLGVAEMSNIDSPETLMNNAKGALQISLGRSNAVTIYG